MNYPVWDLPFGYGYLLAGVAVLHVFISHFAIGGGFFLIVTERSARKTGDVARLKFLESLSKFFVLTTVVAGTLRSCLRRANGSRPEISGTDFSTRLSGPLSYFEVASRLCLPGYMSC